MRTVAISLLAASLLLAPLTGQVRSTKKEPTFPEAVDQAKKAFDGEEFGSAVSALQAAIRAVQKKQRVAILAALPKPDGWTFEDDEPTDLSGLPFASMAALGMTVTRHYHKGDAKNLNLEVTANSPVVQMISMLFANPSLITADGGEIIEYGSHKAILKKQGEKQFELQILMHNKHLAKANSEGLTSDELLAVMNQALVDKLEKPLGK